MTIRTHLEAAQAKIDAALDLLPQAITVVSSFTFHASAVPAVATFTGVAPGDRLIAAVVRQSAEDTITPAGWAQEWETASGGWAAWMEVFSRVATEAGSVPMQIDGPNPAPDAIIL